MRDMCCFLNINVDPVLAVMTRKHYRAPSCIFYLKVFLVIRLIYPSLSSQDVSFFGIDIMKR